MQADVAHAATSLQINQFYDDVKRRVLVFSSEAQEVPHQARLEDLKNSGFKEFWRMENWTMELSGGNGTFTVSTQFAEGNFALQPTHTLQPWDEEL